MTAASEPPRLMARWSAARETDAEGKRRQPRSWTLTAPPLPAVPNEGLPSPPETPTPPPDTGVALAPRGPW